MKLKCYFVLLAIITLNRQYAECANILFFFGVSTYSHRIVAWPLVEALVERNHSVTFFQPDKNKNPHPKVTEVNPVVDGISEQYNFMKGRFQLGPRRLMLDLTYLLPHIGLGMCDMFLKDPKIVEWIKKSKFDLIVVDGLFNECAYGIGYLHKAKVIVFGTSHTFSWYPDALGFPAESYAFPDLHFGLDLPLDFAKRVVATSTFFYFKIIRDRQFPKLEKLLRERLDIPDMPTIPEMITNTSLLFTSSHFSEELARSHPPNVVSIGGMTCVDSSKLKEIPKNILDFIEGGGNEGFVLVSFGSGAKISDAPEHVQNIFFRAFEQTKIRYLWKWEGERPKRMPANIMTTKWVPQQEVLAHPKLRAFITHGGLISMHEAICNKVPMIAFPVFAEQDFNSERLHRTKRGIRLEITTVTQEQLEEAIKSVLYDETYKKNVEIAATRFLDRPQSPVETAVWWTEYVLRQEDTSFMRPLGAGLNWYQIRLLDVWAFFAAIGIALLYVSLRIVSFTVRKIIGEPKGYSDKSRTKVKSN